MMPMTLCTMPCSERQAFQFKTFHVCTIASLLLLVGSGLFIFIFLTFIRCPEKGINNSAGDSMYDGCDSEVVEIPVTQGWNAGANLSQAWSIAGRKAKQPVHSHMEREHSTSIYLYTNATKPDIGQDIKTATRTADINVHQEVFNHHSLYFYLSKAIQILRHDQVPCRYTHLRTQAIWNQNISNKDVHFGTFILNFAERSTDSARDTSCFDIYTCFSADITYYSTLNRTGQVLIPPYEAFKVTSIETNNQGCKVLYTLRSNMDCVYDREGDTLHQISIPKHVSKVILVTVVICVIVASSLLSIIVFVKMLKVHKKVTAFDSSDVDGYYSSIGVKL